MGPAVHQISSENTVTMLTTASPETPRQWQSVTMVTVVSVRCEIEKRRNMSKTSAKPAIYSIRWWEWRVS